MNRSYTKIRKIREANMLLESRFLLSEETNKTDKKGNTWSIKVDPTTKKYKIFVKTFGKDEMDASKSTDQNVKKFIDAGYFKEFNSENDATPTFNQIFNFVDKPITPVKTETPSSTSGTTSGDTQTTSGQTKTTSDTTSSSSSWSMPTVTDDEAIDSIASGLQNKKGV